MVKISEIEKGRSDLFRREVEGSDQPVKEVAGKIPLLKLKKEGSLRLSINEGAAPLSLSH